MKRWLILLPLSLASANVAVAQPADEARRDSERALFKQIVEYQTVAGRTEEFRKLTTLLTKEFAKAGITDVIIKDHDDVQTLIARWPAARPSGKKPILLMAHMDVVDAKAEDWQNPPFELREKDGYYLGRGTIDNKAALTGIVLALQNLHRSGFQPTRDIIVLFTGDEETTANGARRAASEWRSLIDAEYALNGDAGGGAVDDEGKLEAFYMQVAEKIYADFTLVATNRGGHSSAPRQDNAIKDLAYAITAIERHRFPQKINAASRKAYEDWAATDGGAIGDMIRQFLADPTNDEVADNLELVDPGGTRTRCVTTMLSGGHAPNALPQRAQANVNCRIFPGTRIEDVRQTLQTLAGERISVSLGQHSAESDASVVPDDVMQAYLAAIGTRFADPRVSLWMSAGATDGSYLRNVGIPVFGFGGLWGKVGETYTAHGLDEKVWAEGFHGQMQIWEEALRRLAGE